MLGLTGMGGGATGFMWAGGGVLYDIFAFGRNAPPAYARLGLNDRVNRSSPTQIPSGTDDGWKYLWNGGMHYTAVSFATREDGTMWSWGSAGDGMTGTNCQGPPSICDRAYSSPVQIGTDTNWGQLAYGEKHAVAVKTDGTMWNWGQYQRLAKVPGVPNPQQGNRSSPMQVGTDTNWAYDETKQKVWADNYKNFAIKTDGTLWCWGTAGPAGALMGSMGMNDDSSEPNNRFSRSSPMQVGTNTTWDYMCDGYYHQASARKTDGTMWVWGSSNEGALGLGNEIARSSPTQLPGNWSKVCVNGRCSYGIKTNGTLWSWGGYNNYGQRGLNGQGFVQTQYPVGWVPETKIISSPAQVGTNTNWHDITAKEDYCLALKSDGSYWAWGRNQYGELGLNDLTHRSSPTQIPGKSGGRTDILYGNFGGGDSNSFLLTKQ